MRAGAENAEMACTPPSKWILKSREGHAGSSDDTTRDQSEHLRTDRFPTSYRPLSVG